MTTGAFDGLHYLRILMSEIRVAAGEQTTDHLCTES